MAEPILHHFWEEHEDFDGDSSEIYLECWHCKADTRTHAFVAREECPGNPAKSDSGSGDTRGTQPKRRTRAQRRAGAGNA